MTSSISQVVVDADCLIAGTLAPSGAASDLLDLWQGGELELIVCPQLIYEVSKSLMHPRIAKKYGVTSGEVDSFAQRLWEEGVQFDDPKEPPRMVPRDPGDDYLIALALTSRADCLVTRDQHFSSVRVEDLSILSPRQMLKRLMTDRTP